MDTSCELEDLRQENHRLTLKLENLKSTTTTEIDYLKEEVREKERELKEQVEKIREDSKGRECSLLERIDALNEDLNIYKDEIEKLKEQKEQLKLSLEHQRQRNNESFSKKTNYPVSLDQLEALQDSLTDKEKALNLANETISSQSDRLREYSEAIDTQRTRIAELNEDIESKQLTILEQQDRIRHLELERNEQKQVEELEKCDGLKNRGNSLFSEVEERRVKVEDELKRLRDKVTKLTMENIELQAAIERGDSRHNAVNHQLQMLQKSEEQVIKEFKQLKSERVNLFEKLNERIDNIRVEYLKRLKEYQGGALLSTNVEKLAEERDKLLMAKIDLERELFECRKELKFIRHTKTECESHLKILRIKIQEQAERRSASQSPRKKKDSKDPDYRHSHQDKTPEHSSSSAHNSMEIVENYNLDKDKEGAASNSKKSAEEMPECKQQ